MFQTYFRTFDEEEQQEEVEEEFELRDESDNVDGEEGGDGEAAPEDGGASHWYESSKSKADKDSVFPRQIAEMYPLLDPIITTDKAFFVLSILNSSSSFRDCEIQLFDYQHFNIVAIFPNSATSTSGVPSSCVDLFKLLCTKGREPR
ncbi:uncharacterized protein EV420DRAFT_416315 [Desarmillaria tabescens]|uniref:Uncharacterized protein n=1 Tax=Armillaria tabescens TaxID=1929756 RepID=A0AA39N502_ARMTA|nr:uncharacterized protein EV420DRAFT_416315 [Desarmillaria tabescens]KAK0458117.1 hypothetical protein EV420DRAFT_416315 [Desarmillaria tabescens]